MSSTESIAERRLLDRLAPPIAPEDDPVLGLVATTYNLQPDFFDTDFLPAIFGLGAWDDRGWATRIALERRLQRMDAATIFMEAGRYEGRPRSLQVEIVTSPGRIRQTLHAKVLVVLREQAVQLSVGSANLSESGYRLNREVASIITASATHPASAPLIRSAIEGLQKRLGGRLTKGAAKVLDSALDLLSEWSAASEDGEDAAVLWGGGEVPLWQAFMNRWPSGEKVEFITIVSPFWSEDAGNGPLHRLLKEMSRREILVANASVRLLTDGERDTQGLSRPKLPGSYATCDLASFGVNATAQAVDPTVLPEEVAGQEGFLGTRSLHAKVMLWEGPATSLVFAGSANFTHSGWGLLDDPTRANIEGGVVAIRTGRRRAEARMLIPATVGAEVELGKGQSAHLAPVDASPDDPPWPEFIREILLAPMPQQKEELGLLIRIYPDKVGGQWSVGLPAKGDMPGNTLAASNIVPNAGTDQWLVALDRGRLNQLLVGQEVLVFWSACPQGRLLPINVAADARPSLPVSPGSPDLREEHLIAYYQGKIRWEDLFPDPDTPTGGPESPEGLPPQITSEVDTSKIQSYQIREFVEALSGIREDLRDAIHSEPAMRLAVLGSVSPIALARTVMAAVKAGNRTPTAAAFQLVEILACIESARRLDVAPKLKDTWAATVDMASAEICEFLMRLREVYGKELKASRMFDRYEAIVRKHCCGRKG